MAGMYPRHFRFFSHVVSEQEARQAGLGHSRCGASDPGDALRCGSGRAAGVAQALRGGSERAEGFGYGCRTRQGHQDEPLRYSFCRGSSGVLPPLGPPLDDKVTNYPVVRHVFCLDGKLLGHFSPCPRYSLMPRAQPKVTKDQVDLSPVPESSVT